MKRERNQNIQNNSEKEKVGGCAQRNFKMYHKAMVEKAMAPHSSTLAWKIPWTKEPGRLQSMGLRRVGHN